MAEGLRESPASEEGDVGSSSRAESSDLWPYAVLTPFLAAGATAAAGFAAPELALLLAILVLALTRWSVRRLAKRVRLSENELCRLDMELLQSQKLAAVGALSSGIAHEINNPLAIISQEAELVRELMGQAGPLAPEIEDCLAEIRRQVERAGSITHGLLDFSRKRQPVAQSETLDRILEDMVVLVEREAIKKGARVVRSYDPELPSVRVDVPLLRQVVLNLLNNALYAVSDGGTITVSTRRHSRNRAAVSVADDGMGIAPEDLSRIFNPFFTTKPPGQGTGLGLSISHNIVERLGGSISVTSEPGKGAAFTVLLPL